MIATLENIRLRAGDVVNVRIGTNVYRAEILKAHDPAKLFVRLETGNCIWIGRRAVRVAGGTEGN